MHGHCEQANIRVNNMTTKEICSVTLSKMDMKKSSNKRKEYACDEYIAKKHRHNVKLQASGRQLKFIKEKHIKQACA